MVEPSSALRNYLGCINISKPESQPWSNAKHTCISFEYASRCPHSGHFSDTCKRRVFEFDLVVSYDQAYNRPWVTHPLPHEPLFASFVSALGPKGTRLGATLSLSQYFRTLRKDSVWITFNTNLCWHTAGGLFMMALLADDIGFTISRQI